MPVHTQTDTTLDLSFTIGGNQVAAGCQVITGSITPAAPGRSTPVPTACGDVVSEKGDPQTGTITVDAFKDTGATGLTRVLLQAAIAGTDGTYSWTETDENGVATVISGQCTVPAPTIDFNPAKLGRHGFTLELTTSVLADYVAP